MSRWIRMTPIKDYVILNSDGSVYCIFKKGISILIFRDAKAWRRLRNMVFKRDNNKCVNCGREREHDYLLRPDLHRQKFTTFSLHCHHIISVIENPDLAYDIDNCITLCEDCHKEIHRVGEL